MAKSERRVRLRNHMPRRVPRAYKRVGIELSARAEITVIVRAKGSDAEWSRLVEESISGPPARREYLTHAGFGKAWGASPEDLAKVSAFGRTYGLKTVSSDPWRRCVVLSATLERLQEAFGAELYGIEHPLGTFRSIRGTPSIDASIHPIVEGVLGLDNLPSMKNQLVTYQPDRPLNLNLGELRTVYGFPPQFDGKGQRVAVIELGGGIHKRDYNEYFRRVGLPRPPLRIRTINGATNDPAPRPTIKKALQAMADGTFPWGDPTASDIQVLWTNETAMDLQTVGNLAPEATLLLVLAPDDDQGQFHAITSVLAEARRPASVISCSWSFTEKSQTPILMTVLDRWFQAAAVLGVTVCYASGDAGDGTLAQTGKLTFETNFPPSSPYVLACGGTTLDVPAGTERAWKQVSPDGFGLAGGGGFSEVFDLPQWQISAGIDSADWIPSGDASGTGRGVPDVSAKADLDSQFCFLVGGESAPAGGTSLATPVWAALIAVLNQALGHRAGFINPLLYEGGLDKSLRDITRGNTGHLHARRGWDPCTGWGSPHGEEILGALTDVKETDL